MNRWNYRGALALGVMIAWGSLAMPSFAAETTVGLNGYCPVAYHKMGMLVKGKKEFSAVHEGKTYYFVKEAARDAFKKNPQMFLPTLNGLCVVCKAKGMDNPGKPEIFSVYKKKLYLFAGAGSKKTFDENPEKYAKFVADNPPLALGGYCPVAYHKMGKAVKGKKEFRAVYKNKTYYFVKAAARDAFKKNPQMFVPALGGLCIVCKVKGMDNPGKPELFSVYKKKLYLFAGAGSQKAFNANPEKFVAAQQEK